MSKMVDSHADKAGFPRACSTGSLLILVLMFVVSSAWGRSISGVTLNWEPHYGDSLEDGGAFSVIVTEAFRRSGHDLNIEFISWTRALQTVEKGENDVVLGAYFNEERTNSYIFSDVIYNVDLGIMALKSLGIDTVNSLGDLEGYTIGVSRGYANTEEFDKAEFLTREVASGPLQNIRKLFRKRVDMVVGAFDAFGYQARQEGYCIDRMVFIQPPLQSNGLYIMASRNIPDGEQIIQDFNQGLASMKADGTLRRIVNRYLR